tara:strand:- start:1085 stop:1354 length:270 start_codon:yes stop_codon:yes gene_type:complete
MVNAASDLTATACRLALVCPAAIFTDKTLTGGALDCLKTFSAAEAARHVRRAYRVFHIHSALASNSTGHSSITIFLGAPQRIKNNSASA